MSNRNSIKTTGFKGIHYLEVYYPNVSFDGDEFTEGEIHILESVARLFKGKNTGDIVRLSHEEQAWKDNEGDRQLIDYQRYAFGVGNFLGLSD